MSPEPAAAAPHRMAVFERRVLWGAVLVAAPALTCTAVLMLVDSLSPTMRAVLTGAVCISTFLIARWQYRRVLYPIYTLAGLLEALREGDYSLRGARGGQLTDAIYQVNALADQLQGERRQFEESSHLFRKTLAALDSAVFVFDDDSKLRLLNPSAQRLLTAEQRMPLGRDAAELRLDALLALPTPCVVNHVFPARSGRYDIRRARLRIDRRNGLLLVISDVSRVLREEEQMAWQRLLRVISHEVNNSLASIRSLAGTLETMIARETLASDWREDSRSGLATIGNRADSLARFLAGYSRLARLPPPQKKPVDLAAMVAAVARLEQRLPIHVETGAALQVEADPDQLEQALINLLHNAVEATLPGSGAITMRWHIDGDRALIEIADEGVGLPASDNLFVPFFTTKPGGSGIGLALVRQIAEAHGGEVTLSARAGCAGTVARLWLPITLDQRDP